MSPDLKQKLKKALAGKAAVEMGQFQFINLDEVRERAGDDWPNIRAKTYEVSSHFIEKRLDPDDALIRCQGGFLIIFSLLGGIEAEAHVAEIAEGLKTFFLGENGLEQLKLEAEARRVPTEEFLDIVARTQAEDEPELERQDESGRVEETVRHAAASWDEDAGPKRAQDDALQDWSHDDYALKVWDEIVFRPVWDARSSTLLHNYCVARRAVGDRHVYGRDTLMGQDDGPRLRRLDRETALAAQRGFQSLHRQGASGSIIIPVHYETLAAVSDRLAYFKVLQAVPQHLRRFFQIRIESIPDGVPLAQMQEVLRSSQAFGSTIFVSLPFSWPWDVARYEACGVGVFSVSLPCAASEAEPEEDWLIAVMSLFADARAMKAQVELGGIRNPDFVDAGVSAGVAIFSGPLIGGDQKLPQTPVQRAVGEILRPRPPATDPDDIAYI